MPLPFRSSAYLLPCHQSLKVGFIVLDHITAYVNGHSIDLTGELKGRFIERRCRSARIGADSPTAGQSHAERGRVGILLLSNELTIYIKLRAAGRSLATPNIRLSSHLKLEPQLMLSRRH